MAKTLFKDGMIATPELFTRLNNQTLSRDPQNDGDIALFQGDAYPETPLLDDVDPDLTLVGFSGGKTVPVSMKAVLRSAPSITHKTHTDTSGIAPVEINNPVAQMTIYSVKKRGVIGTGEAFDIECTSRGGAINTKYPVLILSMPGNGRIVVSGCGLVDYPVYDNGFLLIIPTADSLVSVLAYCPGYTDGSFVRSLMAPGFDATTVLDWDVGSVNGVHDYPFALTRASQIDVSIQASIPNGKTGFFLVELQQLGTDSEWHSIAGSASSPAYFVFVNPDSTSPSIMDNRHLMLGVFAQGSYRLHCNQTDARFSLKITLQCKTP